jgi:orotate phosphoribosyltransferase
LTGDEILDEFRDAGALLEGHFILSSGLRSPVFLQKMRIFEDPVRTARVCGALAGLIRESFGQVDIVVSPAIGGIIPGYETARALGCKAARRCSSNARMVSSSSAAASRFRRARGW